MIFRATITSSTRPQVRVLYCPPSFSFGKFQGRGFRPTQNSYGSQPACCAVTQKHNVNANASIFPRCSGILLHVTSLPGGHGIGDLGDSAYEFVEFLAQSQQKIWQVLPLGPTGYGDSPYQLFSAFAGNPLLIDLYTLRERGLLSSQDLDSASGLPDDHVEYGRVIDLKQDLIHRAARTFLADGTHADREAFDVFCLTKDVTQRLRDLTLLYDR